MTEIGQGIKRTFFRGMEVLGRKAAAWADKAQDKLKELSAQRQMDEIKEQVVESAKKAFAEERPLPEEMTILLSELNRLEEEYGKAETEEEPAIEEETPDAGEEQ